MQHYTFKLLNACDTFQEREMRNIKGKGIDDIVPLPAYGSDSCDIFSAIFPTKQYP